MSRDVARTVLSAYRLDYSPVSRCNECHCEDCVTPKSKPCCVLAEIIQEALKVVRRPRGRG